MASDFSNNTLIATSCQSTAKDRPFGLTGTGLDDVPFLAAVLDSLERIGIGPTIPAMQMCTALDAYRSMTCSMINKSLPGNLDAQALRAQIAYKLMVGLPS